MRKMNNANRLLSVLLSICLMLSMVSPFHAYAEGALSSTTIDGVSYYQIGTADDLYAFMEMVNGGATGANAILTADIVVNENLLVDGALASGTFREWFPIGYWYDTDGNGDYEDVIFKGIFDGNNHTISGLYFNNLKQSFVGLVGQNGGTVRNLGIVDSYINSYTCGGVVGWNVNGTVENCYYTGMISGNYSVGGVAGVNDGSVANCFNYAQVNGIDEVGGVVGTNGDTVTNCYYLSGTAAGGIDGADVDGSAEAKTSEQFASGEVAYLLNGSDSEGVWGQDSSANDYPVFSDEVIYKNRIGGCCEENYIYGYSNTQEAAVTSHIYEEGICACGDEENGYQIKWQITNGTTADSKSTNVRLVTYVDNLSQYSKVVFTVSFADAKGNTYSADMQCTTVYEALMAGGVVFPDASKVFGTSDAKYFVTHSIMNWSNALFDTEVKVTAKRYDLSGNVVSTATRVIKISDGIK